MENCSVSQRKSLSCRYAVRWCALNIREVYKSGISKDQCFCICFNFLVCACGCLSLECHVRFVKDQMTKCAVKHMSIYVESKTPFGRCMETKKLGWPSHNVQAKKVQVLTPHRSCVFARLKKHLFFLPNSCCSEDLSLQLHGATGLLGHVLLGLPQGSSSSLLPRRNEEEEVQLCWALWARGVKVEQFRNRLH